MKTSLLKYVTISSKRIKKHLLISHKEIGILRSFIQNTTNSEVMIVNTNLGLEIYYLSSIDYSTLIKNSFLLIAFNKDINKDEYLFSQFNSGQEIKDKIQKSLLKLSTMPLAFTCYSKNLFNQLKESYKDNQQIILELFAIFENVLIYISIHKLNTLKIKQFVDDLESLPINIHHNSISKLGLIREAINSIRSN